MRLEKTPNEQQNQQCEHPVCCIKPEGMEDEM